MWCRITFHTYLGSNGWFCVGFALVLCDFLLFCSFSVLEKEVFCMYRSHNYVINNQDAKKALVFFSMSYNNVDALTIIKLG